MITFDRVTFTYPESPFPALNDVSLELPAEALTVVTGLSGTGKSTLLRCINGLVPHFSGGTIAGEVRVSGHDPIATGPERMYRHVGFVFQDPETQFVMDRVEDEVAFALENAAVPRPEMQVRVEEALTLLDLIPLRRRTLATLSGGEKQRVAIAAALALRPSILVLDEPTSQLDAQSAEELLRALVRLKEEQGLTLVLAEHRLERILPFADHLVYLPSRDGDLHTGPPQQVLPEIDLAPPVVELGKALGWSPLPLTPETAPEVTAPKSRPVERPSATTSAYLTVEALHVAYNGQPVLRGVDLALRPGEVAVLMGRNGAGKSTLLKAMVGLVRPQQGRVLLEGRNTVGMEVAEICREVAYLPQDPNALLFADTVREELEITLNNHHMAPSEAPVAPDALLKCLGLRDKAQSYPRDLSAGERQRVALAAVMITAPQVMLLDEPTRGLDYAAKARLLDLVERWREENRALLLVTHDVELAAAAADRVIVMDAGKIVAEGAPSKILHAQSPFAPQMVRLFPDSGWLTVDDVLAHLPAPVKA